MLLCKKVIGESVKLNIYFQEKRSLLRQQLLRLMGNSKKLVTIA